MMMRPSALRPSARATKCPATECPGDQVSSNQVPNGHRVPSDPKSIQIKPKGGRKLLPPVKGGTQLWDGAPDLT